MPKRTCPSSEGRLVVQLLMVLELKTAHREQQYFIT